MAAPSPRELIILTRIPGIGCLRLRSLVDRFGSYRALALASPRELAEADGIDPTSALTISRFLRSSAAQAAGILADVQLRRAALASGRILTLWDDEYPACLKRIHDPPVLLFVLGGLLQAGGCSLAIVGTRSPTPCGIAAAEYFAAGLARSGITVVSGLARGIDSAAHDAALRAGGRTLAIIGSGIDVIYPPENRPLAGRIARQGAVVSEFLMGARPAAANFPRRNRIISGTTLGTLIIESGVNGGAMITAAKALEQNRLLFAVPSGPSGKVSGTNRLIREGKALLTESVEEILAALGPRLTIAPPPEACPAKAFSLIERRVHDAMEASPLHLNQIAARSGLAETDTLVHLLSLESKGVVRQMAGRVFVKT